MRLIDRTYPVRGKQIRLQELADLAAVRSQPGRGNKRSTVASLDEVPEAVQPSLRAFESAGWEFVPREQAPEGARVYLKSAGRLALSTNRLTVRLSSSLAPEQAREFLSRHGITSVEPLKFAPNLFTVTLPPGEDVLEAAARLTRAEGVEFAEPELLEPLSGR